MKAKAKYGQAIRLASTTDLSRKQWLAIRKLGLGSSDAAVAVGLSPYKCPLSLWLEKTGRKEPEDISHKEAVLWGIELEPVLAQVYAKRTGYRVRRVNAVLQHPEHLFMLANLDREVVGHPDGPGILEIKTASYHSAPMGGGRTGRLPVSGTPSARRHRSCLGGSCGADRWSGFSDLSHRS